MGAPSLTIHPLPSSLDFWLVTQPLYLKICPVVLHFLFLICLSRAENFVSLIQDHSPLEAQQDSVKLA